ncbi:hypothetical protein V1511DRAFT_513117 [Dipodascopsis uninucleata]
MSVNTGPKGVINDAKLAAEQEVLKRNERNERNREVLLGRAQVSTTVIDDMKQQSKDTRLENAGINNIQDLRSIYKEHDDIRDKLKSANTSDEDDNDLDSELEELLDLDLEGGTKREDLAMLQSWRDQRLRELQDSAAKSSIYSGSEPQQSFGSLEEVGGNDYLKALYSSSDAHKVVLVLYDESAECVLICKLLEMLAQKHYTTHFIKMYYSESDMSQDCLPTILAYSDGGDQLVANIVRVIDEIPPNSDISAASLEDVLKR